jgi:hypothetical protein
MKDLTNISVIQENSMITLIQWIEKLPDNGK